MWKKILISDTDYKILPHTEKNKNLTTLERIRLVYLPHGQGAHVSHENVIILLYKRIVYMYTLYIRWFVSLVSLHTREKKTARIRLIVGRIKKIHEINKNANRALIDAAHDDNQCQIDRKSKLACINYKTSTTDRFKIYNTI